MVRTGARAARLMDALEETGLQAVSSNVAPARPTLAELPEVTATELLDLYRALGGLASAPTFRPGGWDLAFGNGLVVELDEELHFNRYRGATLVAAWEAALPWVESYRSYCVDHERACVHAGCWGKRWTNPSTARMFSGSPVGELEGNGAPRWKQRALYDAIKDTAPLLSREVHLARLATHDTIDGTSVGAMLDGAAPLNAEAIRMLVDGRTATSTSAPERSTTFSASPTTQRSTVDR